MINLVSKPVTCLVSLLCHCQACGISASHELGAVAMVLFCVYVCVWTVVSLPGCRGKPFSLFFFCCAAISGYQTNLKFCHQGGATVSFVVLQGDQQLLCSPPSGNFASDF